MHQESKTMTNNDSALPQRCRHSIEKPSHKHAGLHFKVFSEGIATENCFHTAADHRPSPIRTTPNASYQRTIDFSIEQPQEASRMESAEKMVCSLILNNWKSRHNTKQLMRKALKEENPDLQALSKYSGFIDPKYVLSSNNKARPTTTSKSKTSLKFHQYQPSGATSEQTEQHVSFQPLHDDCSSHQQLSPRSANQESNQYFSTTYGNEYIWNVIPMQKQHNSNYFELSPIINMPEREFKESVNYDSNMPLKTVMPSSGVTNHETLPSFSQLINTLGIY